MTNMDPTECPHTDATTPRHDDPARCRDCGSNFIDHDRLRTAPYGRFRAIKRNSEALDAVLDRVPFANRSHTLTGRPVYAPAGSIITRVDATGDALAHITVTTPAAPEYEGIHGPGTFTQTVVTGELPPVHVSALMRALYSAAAPAGAPYLYVVHSFATPIAWSDSMEPGAPLFAPRVRYTPTTSKHQANVTGRYPFA